MGTAFEVSRGNMTVTDKDLHLFDTSAIVKSAGRDEIVMSITAKLQRAPGTPIKVNKRVDTYKVIWTSRTSGILINTFQKFEDDRSTSTISGDVLEISSRIARNGTMETQTYKVVR